MFLYVFFGPASKFTFAFCEGSRFIVASPGPGIASGCGGCFCSRGAGKPLKFKAASRSVRIASVSPLRMP